jgi:hypothetical protein
MTFDEYTNQNATTLSASLTAFEQQETPKGFISSFENGRALIQSLIDNNLLPSVENLAFVAKLHTPELGYKFYYTSQELSLQNMRSNFTAAQLTAFDAWWGRQKHLVHTPQAESSILAQMVGRVFTNDAFDSAAGRCSHTGQVEEHRSVHYQPGQYSNRTDLTDSVKPEEMLDVFGQPIHKSTAYRGSIREQYEAAVAARAERDHTPESNSQAEAQREAEAMRGNTYSRTDQIQKMFITTQSGDIDWVATRNVRRQIQDMPGDGRGSGRSA